MVAAYRSGGATPAADPTSDDPNLLLVTHRIERVSYYLEDWTSGAWRCMRQMSEQARKVEHEAIPERAQGLYYDKGLFSEVLAYYDDEALYFEARGKDHGIVRFSFEMLETLTRVVDEKEEDQEEEQAGSQE
jgi:hypothetical protein